MTRKTLNNIWTFINALLITGESVIIWAIISNEKNLNLGLWNFIQGNFGGFSGFDGLIVNAVKILIVLAVLFISCVVFSNVKANLRIGKLLIDIWPLLNLAVSAFILLSVYAQYRHYSPYYRGQCDIHDARVSLESERAIVHGAGFIEDDQGNLYDYTNSLEALTNSYNMGNRIVEMDFLWTIDGKMVCAHESETFARGIDSDEALTEEEFLAQKSYGTFTTMNVEMLADFMREHQDLYIVTDFKYELPESCEYISQVYPDLRDRFIVQMYHYGQYEFIRNLGFNNIILTLYLTTDDERDIEKLCEFVKKHDLVALTFWESYLDNAEEWGRGEEFWNAVKALYIPTCVHTVNDVGDIQHDFEQGVTAVYTDNVDNGWMK